VSNDTWDNLFNPFLLHPFASQYANIFHRFRTLDELHSALGSDFDKDSGDELFKLSSRSCTGSQAGSVARDAFSGRSR
jgi:hypothetical protein